jgi:hypothetical protein
MTPVFEEKSNNSREAFGRGFADGIGSVGNLVVLCRRDHVRRSAQMEIKRRDSRADWSMIYRDLNVALDKSNERREE